MHILEFKPQPCEQTINLLRHLLELAEDGEILGIAGISVNVHDSTMEFKAGTIADHVVKAVGALEILKLKLIDDNVEF